VLEQNLAYRDHIPEGWRPLFDALVTDLHEIDPAFRVVQAKQKFGELRVYLEASSPRSLELIDAATRQSKKACEICGAQADLRVTHGYYQTLCAEHRGESLAVARSPLIARLRVAESGVTRVD
jgi:hypothetical protein